MLRDKQRRDQTGRGLISWLVTLTIISFIFIFIIRLFPIYKEYYSVQTVVDSMKVEMQAQPLTKQQVMVLLMKRIENSDIQHIKKENILLLTSGNHAKVTQLNIQYQVETPFIFNIHLLTKFDVSAVVDE